MIKANQQKKTDVGWINKAAQSWKSDRSNESNEGWKCVEGLDRLDARKAQHPID